MITHSWARLTGPVVSLLILALGAGTAAATTFFVNAGTGDDTNTCLSDTPGAPPVGPCKTINAAIGKASDSGTDVIRVAAGTYAETVTIAKGITLFGAQANVDPRTRSRLSESVITHPCGPVQIPLEVEAFIDINGFTIQGADASACPSGTGAGVWMPAGLGAQPTMFDNIIRDNTVGVRPVNTGAIARLVIRENSFEANNRPGPGSGSGIYADAELTNVDISQNRFVGNKSASIYIRNGSGSIRIASNQTDGSPIALLESSGVTIERNAVVGSPATPSSGVYIGGGVSGVSIANNALVNASTAIAVEDPLSLGANSGVTARGNCITGNAVAGLKIACGAYSGGPLDATGNWWGAASGPGPIGPGTGDKIAAAPADVDFSGFLTVPAAACDLAPGFRDLLRGADINDGPDVCGTGHTAVNFTGTAGPAGSTWLTVLRPSSVAVPLRVRADVLIKPYNNAKGPGLVALFNEGAGKKGLGLFLLDNGNSDRLALTTLTQTGALTTLANLPLGGQIKECVWYRVEMQVTANPALPSVKVVGRVFSHADPADPNSAVEGQIGGDLVFTGTLTAVGLTSPGEVGIAATATSASVDSSVANFEVED